MNGGQRFQARDARRRRAQPATLPKFFRPKVDAATQATVRIIHWDLIDRFVKGTATRDDLWDWIETGYTYSLMMTMLAEDGSEFTPEAVGAVTAQLSTYEAIIERFRRTGRPGFTGTELQAARTAAEVFDQLIGMDRHGIAGRAAAQSLAIVQQARKALPA